MRELRVKLLDTQAREAQQKSHLLKENKQQAKLTKKMEEQQQVITEDNRVLRCILVEANKLRMSVCLVTVCFED